MEENDTKRFLNTVNSINKSMKCALCGGAPYMYYPRCTHWFCKKCRSMVDPTCPFCNFVEFPRLVTNNTLMEQLLKTISFFDTEDARNFLLRSCGQPQPKIVVPRRQQRLQQLWEKNGGAKQKDATATAATSVSQSASTSKNASTSTENGPVPFTVPVKGEMANGKKSPVHDFIHHDARKVPPRKQFASTGTDPLLIDLEEPERLPSRIIQSDIHFKSGRIYSSVYEPHTPEARQRISMPNIRIESDLSTPRTTQDKTKAAASSKQRKRKSESNVEHIPKRKEKSEPDPVTPKSKSLGSKRKSDSVKKPDKEPEMSPKALEKKNSYSETPLIIACKGNEFNKVESLLRLGADVNAQNWEYSTCLHFAVLNNDLSLLNLLLKNGALVNVPNNVCKTPLHLAVETELIRLCEPLLVYGADPMRKDLFGNTPRELADLTGNAKLIALLSKSKKPDKNGPKEPKYPSLHLLMPQRTEKQDWGRFLELSKCATHCKVVTQATHVVLSRSFDMKALDFDVIKTAYNGGRLIKFQWVSDSLREGRMLPTDQYEVIPDWMPGFSKARENAAYHLPGLFKGCYIFFHYSDTCYPFDFTWTNNGKKVTSEIQIRLRDVWEFLGTESGCVLKNGKTLKSLPDLNNLTEAVPFYAAADGDMAECYVLAINMPKHWESPIAKDTATFKVKSFQWLISAILNCYLDIA